MPVGYFVDSIALVRRYVYEKGTSFVRRLTRHSPSTVIYVVHITLVNEAATAEGLTVDDPLSRP